MRLSRFQKWAAENGADLIEVEDYHYAVFERHERLTRWYGGLGYRPRAFVKVNEHVDRFTVEAGDELTVTVEEWVGSEQEDYSREVVSSTCHTGGGIQLTTTDGLKFIEVGEDGYRRTVTVE